MCPLAAIKYRPISNSMMGETNDMTPAPHTLTAVDLGIDTHQEAVVYMRRDCHVCRSEGFTASTRVLMETARRSVIATLNVVDDSMLPPGHVGLSKVAIRRLRIVSGDSVGVRHAPVLRSLAWVRKKIFGAALSEEEIREIIADISLYHYSDIEISSFLSACAGNRMNRDEIVGLTRAMVACGQRLEWPGHTKVFDKHCVGGLLGNRTTPLVVAIVAAAGLVIPKTSSRAITSPAGTADTMETLTRVDLSMADIQRVVGETGACLAWGGAVNLSPADDVLIRIERVLDLDAEGQLIASVLSKKIAAGSTHVLIDLPVGDTAKVRTRAQAERLTTLFDEVGRVCGLGIRCLITDGSKPVGGGIGPAEEARDLLAVLHRDKTAPQDLRERALLLAANLLDMANGYGLDPALLRATELLDSGQALERFERIVMAQGGFKKLPQARYQHTELAQQGGRLTSVDNRQLARLAKLAGAPLSPAAGLRIHTNVGCTVVEGQPLFTLYSDSTGEHEYAMNYYRERVNMFPIEALS